jgi:hypothetical protein
MRRRCFERQWRRENLDDRDSPNRPSGELLRPTRSNLAYDRGHSAELPCGLQSAGRKRYFRRPSVWEAAGTTANHPSGVPSEGRPTPFHLNCVAPRFAGRAQADVGMASDHFEFHEMTKDGTEICEVVRDSGGRAEPR